MVLRLWSVGKRVKMKVVIIIALSLLAMTGCKKRDVHSTINETPKSSQDTLVTHIGFLSQMILQHPVVSNGFPTEEKSRESQFYFDIGDTSNSMNQIIVVYPNSIKRPREQQRKIELKGSSSSITVTGKGGENSEYKNEVFKLTSWKYLD